MGDPAELGKWLRTVKAALTIQIIHPSTFYIVNLTVNSSWTHGSMNMGFASMTTMMLPDSVNENNLLSWQLINSSRTRVNKPFAAINTAKCGTEDVALQLSHCSHYYYWSWSNRNTVAWNSNPFYGCYIIKKRRKLGHVRVALTI